MNFKKYRISIGIIFFWAVILLFVLESRGYEIFIYRSFKDKKTLVAEHKIFLHGEFFGQVQMPSTFPSFNDLSGLEDRWNYGFRNWILLTDTTTLLAQLVAHDDTTNRTKFDWHFSLRQSLVENCAVIIGHDSDHDSDHQSLLYGKPFYTNRNYIGIGLPLESKGFYIEPFTWFFHHTTQRSHLDLSGSKLQQEYGLRIGAQLATAASLHFQIVAQSDSLFYYGQAFLADLIIRFKLSEWLELAVGGSLWQDIQISPAGNQKSFYKLIWGIAIPF